LATATPTAWTTLARQEAVDQAWTTPVVPRMEMPPSTPSRGFMVLRAITSPPGTLMVTESPRPAAAAAATACRAASPIMRRGTALIAGPPTSSPSPGRVTVPTPSPPRSSSPGSEVQATVAVTRAALVTSGSSPASFTTTAEAQPSPSRQSSTAKAWSKPAGRAMVTSATGAPSSSRRQAARVAAAAQAPVVKPLRSPRRRRGAGEYPSSSVAWRPGPPAS
jgi:hypothetical protein